MSKNREMPPLPAQASEQSGVEQASEVAAPVAKVAKPIEVVAVAAGFYKQQRKVEGNKFSVAKFEELGSWMKCLDPVMQKKHMDTMAYRKEKLRAEQKAGK